MSFVLMVPLISAGLAIGSRRFLLLLPLLIVILPVLVWHFRSFSQAVLEGVGIAVVFGVSWVTLSLIAAPEEFEKFRFGEESFTVIFDFWEAQSGAMLQGVYLPNRAYPDVILGTIDQNSLDSRIERWKFGIEQFRSAPFWGGGFNYQELFSERFVKGTFLDYPHLPLMSEALIGGVPLFLLGLAIYVLLSLGAARSIWSGEAVGLGLMYIGASGVAIISGDTMLSISIWVTVSLTLAAVTRRGRSSDPGFPSVAGKTNF